MRLCVDALYCPKEKNITWPNKMEYSEQLRGWMLSCFFTDQQKLGQNQLTVKTAKSQMDVFACPI